MAPFSEDSVKDRQEVHKNKGVSEISNIESDKEFIRDFIDGKERSFDKFFEKHHKGLFNYLNRLVNRREMAEDLVQETFIKFIKTLDRYDFNFAPSTRLYNIAYTLFLDWVKFESRKKRQAPSVSEEEAVSSPQENPEEKVAGWQLKNALDSCIERLEGIARNIFTLKKEAEMTFDEITETTGVPVRTAKRIMEKTLSSLKNCLEKSGFGLDR